MVSVSIPPLISLMWPPAFKFPDEIPANFEAIITLYHQISNFFWSDAGVSTSSFILYSAGAFLAFTASAWMLLYSFKKKKISEPLIPPASVDAISRGIRAEIVTASDAAYADELIFRDAMYAEEIQVHEVLMASIFTSELSSNPSSSMEPPILNTEPSKFQSRVQHSSQCFCGICLENKESWQMFTNDQCSHSFCYDCMTSHIVTKIRDKLKDITCPALNCKATLDFNACRSIIPDDALVQWDELLCVSLIPESQKLYCPFRDCSAMLVNDSGQVRRKIKCLICKRPFCAECRVPWHSDFTCKEFQKLYDRKGGNDDKIV
ncbi:Ubiquitin--protein ligase [Handroanthus impetiginosus]|uniref:RBR-type E3 ubiquitin transferase n=1 Tax=Handroanthus impetiginosus TaxID=429701 RepID=A0A2G9HVV0_9LAMI|nr:Ubiquitin--protein ligase [Handroanthus impetiginosus]